MWELIEFQWFVNLSCKDFKELRVHEFENFVIYDKMRRVSETTMNNRYEPI